MAGGRSVDVSLVVKAKNEGLDVVAKALDSLAQSQANLGKNSDHVAKVSDSLIKSLDALGNSATKLDGAIKAGASAYDREAAQLAKANEQLAARQARLEQLKTTEAELARIQKEGGTAKKLKDGAFGPELPSLKNTRSEITSQSAKLSSDQKEIERLIGSVAKLRTEYLAAQDAEVSVRAAINATTEEFNRQTIAAAAATAAAEKKAVADAKMARAAAESAEVQARVNRVTGVSRGAATDNGASYAALAAREEEIFLRQAAAAHKAFEARVRQGAEEMRREAQATKEFKRYVRDLVEELNPAARAQRYLTEQTAALDKAMRSNLITKKEYNAALGLVRQKAEQLGSKSELKLFGLAPYQTQNLMMQFNDVATQIASGTPVTQTLAQQGGQILQLFPKIGDAIVAAFKNPTVLSFTAAVAVFATGLARAAENAERLRQVNSLLFSNADGGSYDARGLIEATKAMREFGIAAEDAMKIVRLSVKEGFDQGQIVDFGKTAKGLASIMGTDVVDAANRLAEALRGGFDGIVALDKQTNIFSASQLEMIRTLFEHGKASEALSQATRILEGKLAQVAEKSEGPWTKSINSLAKAWDDLLDSFSNLTVFKYALDGLAAIAEGAAATTRAISGATNLQDKKDQLSNLLDGSNYGFLGLGPSLRERSVATAKGLVAAPGYEKDGTTKLQLDAANALLEEISSIEGGLVSAQKKLTTLQNQQALQIKEKAEDETKVILNRLRVEKEVTTERDKQSRLAEDERRIRLEIASEMSNSKGFTDGQRELVVQEKLKKLSSDYDKSIKSAAESRARSARFAERETDKQAKMVEQAKTLLKAFEGYRSSAYWDVNHFRVGYGSDTVTDKNGTPTTVRRGSTTTPEAADRDLERRVNEIANAIKQKITSERFGQFSPSQQAALISIYYNYGINSERLKKDLEPILRQGTDAQIAAAVRSFGNDNKGVNRNRRNREAELLGIGNLAVAEGSRQISDDLLFAQEKFDDALAEEIRKRQQSADYAKALVGLQGEALIQEQKRQEIADAIADKEAEINRINAERRKNLLPEISFSKEQRDALAAAIGSRYDNETPNAVSNQLQKKVDELTSLRDTLTGQIDYEYGLGNNNFAQQLEKQLSGVNDQLLQAIQNYKNFLNVPGQAEALGLSAEALKQINLQLDGAIERTVSYNRILGLTTDSIANTFTSAATNAIDQFSQSIANGKSAFKSLWQAFRSFASDFLRQIAQMIQQQIIFNLVSGLLKGLTAGMGPSTGGSGLSMPGFSNAGDGIFIAARHSGGLVNRSGAYGTALPMAMFANAARYHSGGIAGLKPGEIPTVLMQGEEVLTRDDPRHVMNGGGGSGKPLTIINAFDESDFITKALNTRTGEQAVLNMVRNNPGAFKAAMG